MDRLLTLAELTFYDHLLWSEEGGCTAHGDLVESLSGWKDFEGVFTYLTVCEVYPKGMKWNFAAAKAESDDPRDEFGNTFSVQEVIEGGHLYYFEGFGKAVGLMVYIPLSREKQLETKKAGGSIFTPAIWDCESGF